MQVWVVMETDAVLQTARPVGVSATTKDALRLGGGAPNRRIHGPFDVVGVPLHEGEANRESASGAPMGENPGSG